jgi:glyoxylase-like metal-dependent hydrolase (beta-lactamase superfamily II)
MAGRPERPQTRQTQPAQERTGGTHVHPCAASPEHADSPAPGHFTAAIGWAALVERSANPAGDDPFAAAAAASVHRLAIPTPFAVGRVNVYLIEDNPLTLVDAGPNSGTSFDELQRGITGLGHALEDIELVILTHQHIDHLGLVSLVAARSGADVAAIDVAVPFIENYSGEADADDGFAREVMLRHGIPEDVVAALQSVSLAFRAWGARADVTRPLRDGEALALRDRTLHVHHRPGHSPSDTVFHDRERRILFAADHLLAHVSSNPLLTRPRDGSVERPKALVQYLNSLAATREMDVDLVLPGHGDPITGHRELIDERFALHRRRADKIHRVLAERPRTAFEIAQALWGNVAVTQAYLTLSEVLGHLDLLLDEGRVRETGRDGVSVFETL